MSRQNSNTLYQSEKIQDIRLKPGYIPAYNRGNQSTGRNTIPGRKRQFSRVHHDSPPGRPTVGTSGSSNTRYSDENRPRKLLPLSVPFQNYFTAFVNSNKNEFSRRSVKMEFPTTNHPPIPTGYKGNDFDTNRKFNHRLFNHPFVQTFLTVENNLHFFRKNKQIFLFRTKQSPSRSSSCSMG